MQATMLNNLRLQSLTMIFILPTHCHHVDMSRMSSAVVSPSHKHAACHAA
jgi:hypothetical protein